MDGMDDEAFARMLQQQILDEELMLEQTNNHPSVNLRNSAPPHHHRQDSSRQPPGRHRSDPHTQSLREHGPYGTQQDQYYDPQPSAGSNYQQPPQSNYQQPPQSNYQQPPPSNYQQPPQSNYQQHPPPPGNYQGGYQQPPPGNYNQPRHDGYYQEAGNYKQPPSGNYSQPPPDNYSQPSPGNYQQEVGNYNQPPPGNYNQPPHGNYSQPPPDNYHQEAGNYKQPSSGNYQPPPDNYQQNHYQQRPTSQSDLYARPPPQRNDSYQQQQPPYQQQPDPYQQQQPPQSNDPYQQQQRGEVPQEVLARPQPTDEEDPDLALARQLQNLETSGMASIRRGPTQQNSSASGGGASGHMTKEEQEVEDSRLARLMMETGKSILPAQQNSSASGGGASGHMTKEEQEVEDSRLARLMMETGESIRNFDTTPAHSVPASSNLSSIPPTPRDRTIPPAPQDGTPTPLDRRTSGDLKSPPPRPRGAVPSMTRTTGAINLKPPKMKSPKASPQITSKRNEQPVDPSGELRLDDAFLDASERLKKDKKKKKGGIFGVFRTSDESLASGDDEGPTGYAAAALPSAENRSGAFTSRGTGRRPRTRSGSGNDRVNSADVTYKSDPNDNGRADPNDDGRPIIPFPIPKPVARPADTIGAPKGPVPYSLAVSKDMPQAPEATVGRRKLGFGGGGGGGTCSACNRPVSNPLIALDKKYHPECFKCTACHEQIDPTGTFAFTESRGDKQPMHCKCYAEMYGIKCAVCTDSIAAGPDGKISFVKHPFFDTEQMCPRHAKNMTRRCTGCHRFEPEREPFADLNDVGRCVCLSCCRTVVVDSSDAQPLWLQVIEFFDKKLHLPIWKDFREVPVLVVGYNALNDQMTKGNNVHGGASQIMTRGLCLTEHESGRRFRSDMKKFDKNNKTFVSSDAEERGFTYFQVPDASKVNPDASVTAILCLSGLPQDLTASVLAHEATHAWIKLHPSFDIRKPIPPQVEEGVAQLIALLFLNEGLGPAPPLEYNDGSGPSDEKLRQYFKFSIETDDHEYYGTGYRRAAMAYSMIGIEALMSHIVLYQDFPET